MGFFGNGGTDESLREKIVSTNAENEEYGARHRLFPDKCGIHDSETSYGCTWRLPYGEPSVVAADNVLMCNNGATCEADDSDHKSSTWGCCNDKCGRARCPQNYPNMCQTAEGLPGCQDGTTYCCEKNCTAIGQEDRSCPCSWVTATGMPITTNTDNLLACYDGTTCLGNDNDHVNGNWDCCDNRGGRIMCPPNYPNMCADPKGSPSTKDYGCYQDCEAAGQGGNRQCW